MLLILITELKGTSKKITSHTCVLHIDIVV